MKILFKYGLSIIILSSIALLFITTETHWAIAIHDDIRGIFARQNPTYRILYKNKNQKEINQIVCSNTRIEEDEKLNNIQVITNIIVYNNIYGMNVRSYEWCIIKVPPNYNFLNILGVDKSG